MDVLNDLCPLCQEQEAISKHHLLPVREFKWGGMTVLLCKDCHTWLHKVFTNDELGWCYCTIDLIKDSPKYKEHDLLRSLMIPS